MCGYSINKFNEVWTRVLIPYTGRTLAVVQMTITFRSSCRSCQANGDVDNFPDFRIKMQPFLVELGELAGNMRLVKPRPSVPKWLWSLQEVTLVP